MVNVLKFWILKCLMNWHVQTVQTQIRLLLRSSLIRVYTVCHSTEHFNRQLHIKQNLSQKSMENKVFETLGHLLYFIFWQNVCVHFHFISEKIYRDAVLKNPAQIELLLQTLKVCIYEIKNYKINMFENLVLRDLNWMKFYSCEGRHDAFAWSVSLFIYLTRCQSICCIHFISLKRTKVCSRNLCTNIKCPHILYTKQEV